MKKYVLLCVVLALAILLVVPAVAVAAPGNGNGPVASGWHLGYYTPSGRALSLAGVQAPAGGIAAFNFTSEPNTALLITDQKAQNPGLLGDLTGKTITATFAISGSDFTFYGEGTSANSGSTPANVRLFFETSSAGGFDATHYWWSDSVDSSSVLADGYFKVTATVDSADWSDYYGQSGLNVPDGFAAAASNVTGIGLSFGGGWFYECGVGTGNGSSTFTLDSFSVSQ